MKVDAQILSRKLREQWEVYRIAIMPDHMTGYERAVKVLAQQLADADPKFQRVEFLKRSINY